MKSIQDAEKLDFKGKKVMVRCDFNVPVSDEGQVRDDLRIRKTLPTIKYLREAGAKLILISHIEGKKAKLENAIDSLRPVFEHIEAHYRDVFGTVTFLEDALSDQSKKIVEGMNDGDVLLFENIRKYEGEKNNDMQFARSLASLADIYVNDAFAVSHRNHASVVSLPALLPHYAGVQMFKEVEALSRVLNPEHPFIFILGGAKFETKLPLIQKFMNGERAADHVLLGGALLNDILKAKGLNVGKSLTAKEPVDLSKVIDDPKLVIPEDVITASAESLVNTAPMSIAGSIKAVGEVGVDDVIVDVGPSMSSKLGFLLGGAKFVLWNGPMGNYEAGFKTETLAMAKLIADTAATGGITAVLGGGDTTASMAELGFDDAEYETKNPNLFISTGGGAMIEFLLNETLPGVEALG